MPCWEYPLYALPLLAYRPCLPLIFSVAKIVRARDRVSVLRAHKELDRPGFMPDGYRQCWPIQFPYAEGSAQAAARLILMMTAALQSEGI